MAKAKTGKTATATVTKTEAPATPARKRAPAVSDADFLTAVNRAVLAGRTPEDVAKELGWKNGSCVSSRAATMRKANEGLKLLKFPRGAGGGKRKVVDIGALNELADKIEAEAAAAAAESAS